MKDVEYYQMLAFLETIIVQIGRKDWEGFMSYCDDLIICMKEGCVLPYMVDVLAQERIKDVAGHMLVIKQIVLAQVAVISHETEVKH